MEPITIREFLYPGDYSDALRLWEKTEKGIHVGASDAPEEIEKKLQRDPELFLVAEANGKLIGTIIGGFDGRRGLIYHVAVVAEFRGQRIGARLMEEVENRLRAKGCIRCYLLVNKDNHEARGFYEKHGWNLLEDTPYAKDLI
jgi:ribosomal protein S18 acetylase RimI-like enzyme